MILQSQCMPIIPVLGRKTEEGQVFSAPVEVQGRLGLHETTPSPQKGHFVR